MLVNLFEKQVQQNPLKLAIKTKNEQITFHQLKLSMYQIAKAILEISGINIQGGMVEKESDDEKSASVALLFEHGIDMIKGMLGALKAGRIYVPLDPSYPEKRLLYMIEHSEASLIITNQSNITLAQKLISTLPNFNYTQILNISEFDGCFPEVRDRTDLNEYQSNLFSTPGKINLITMNTDDAVVSNDDKIAYILYTSGSTGKPKGVIQTQNNIWHFIKNYTKNLSITSGDRLTLFSSFSHDAAVMDVYGGLLNGATLYPVNIKDQVNMRELAKWMIKEKITIWHSVPTVYRYFLKTLTGDESFPDLRYVVLGGEAVIDYDVIQFKEFFNNTTLVNLYGQSESSYNSSQFISTNSSFKKVTLGEVIDDTEIFLVTDDGTEALPLEIGEIIVASKHLALGYWKDEEKTKEVFLDHPELGRLYKTGDMGKLLVNGNIEYIGRKDFQVKIRGYRIEPGEIESQILSHPEVKEAVVITRDDSKENKLLVAFLVTERQLNEKEIREYLKKSLPDYMIPTYFVHLEKMPLTPTNKIDRKTLSQLEIQARQNQEYIPPTNEIEEILVNIWGEILGFDMNNPKISREDNFFNIGGNSLLATSLLLRIYQQLQVQIPLREVFNFPTIRELGEYIIKAQKSVYSSIPQVEKRDYYPVSSAQKRLFILNQFDETSLSYNMPRFMFIEGKLDEEMLVKTFNKLIERHEALRTSFHNINGEIVQKIHHDIDFEVVWIDAKDKQVSACVHNFVKPFDLSKAPLLRVELLKLTDGYLLMCDMHHIIADGTSMSILVKEFVQLYSGNILPELRIQYKDFAVWQNNYLTSKRVKLQENYWLDTFRGEIPILDLPIDYPRPSIIGFEGATYKFKSDNPLKLYQIAQKNSVTLYMLLLACHYILLKKYTGQEDIIIGSPIAGRSHRDLENIIGMFVNTLAIRNYPESKKTFSSFLAEVKENVLKAFENQDYQFEALIEKLNIKRDLSRNPLFDTMFTLQNISLKTEKMGIDIILSPYNYDQQTAKFDLELIAIETEDEINFSIQYNTRLFKPETIERMASHFLNILNEVAANPERKIAEVDILSEEERKQLVYDFNDNIKKIPKNQTVYKIFEKNAANHPDQIAISYQGQNIQYGKLNALSNQLARYLMKLGISEEQPVGILLERSPLIVKSILAVWKVGGVYIPFDPDHPLKRTLQILKDSKVRVLLTHSSIVEETLLHEYDGQIIFLDKESDKTNKENTHNLMKSAAITNLAYIIYTSGSTGKPKGVMVEQIGMLNHMLAKINDLQLTADTILAQTATQCFDISVWQFFAALLVGGKTVIYPKDVLLQPGLFLNKIIEDRVNILEVVPSFLSILLDSLEANYHPLKVLKFLVVTGETIKLKLVRRWFEKYPHIKMVNAYGPSEVSDRVSHYIMDRVPEGENIPIGKPVQNSRVYIVNKDAQLCPIGVKGEIWVSGIGVGRGYLNDPERTDKFFAEDPFIDHVVHKKMTKSLIGEDLVIEESGIGEETSLEIITGFRLYKTGDIGRWLEDGNIEFCGRKDYQIKIRGFRIEVGEIENRLMDHPKIKESVVIDHEDTVGEKFLCAYIVSDGELQIPEVRQYLLDFLPDYMIPSSFVILDKLPLNSNGKIDRKALPLTINHVSVRNEYIAPTGEVEKSLAKIWAEILGLEKVGIQDHFFHIGGHSLKLIGMVSKVLEKFAVQLSLKEFFKDPTIKGVARYISSVSGEESTGCKENSIVYDLDEPYILFNFSQKKKLFCFPPGRGFGLAYSSLASYLQRYSLYGFNFIEDSMRLEKYAKIIEKEQPDEDIVLMGYSAGGNLAFEVAKKLFDKGRIVSDLILLDVYKENNIYSNHEERRIAANNVIEYMKEVDEYKSLIMLPNIKEKIFNRVLHYLEYSNSLVNTGVINSTIHLIKAEDDENAPVQKDTRGLWKSSTSGLFCTYKGFGRHGMMLEGGYAEKNAEIIRKILEFKGC